MDRTQALAELKDRAAASERPVLTDATLERVLDRHVTPDADGRLANDAAWTPTWDLNAAAAACWGLKAGKVAGDFTFSADGASYSKADVMAKCLEMETYWANKSTGVLYVGPYGTETPYYDRDRRWDGEQVP